MFIYEIKSEMNGYVAEPGSPTQSSKYELWSGNEKAEGTENWWPFGLESSWTLDWRGTRTKLKPRIHGFPNTSTAGLHGSPVFNSRFLMVDNVMMMMMSFNNTHQLDVITLNHNFCSNLFYLHVSRYCLCVTSLLSKSKLTINIVKFSFLVVIASYVSLKSFGPFLRYGCIKCQYGEF